MATNLPNPALSIILPTTEGWDQIEKCVRRLEPQIVAVDGELIVVDAHPLPADVKLPERVQHIVVEDGSVFDLRARGLVETTGDVVTVTEDHCEVPDDWCRSIVAAHLNDPLADGIGGSVRNGSCRTIGDWTNFFVTFGVFAPPITRGTGRGLTIANTSYKRRALQDAKAEPGWLEFTLHARLLEPGRTSYRDDIVVTHIQPRSVRATLAAHFHNGRTTTGLARDAWDRRVRFRRYLHCLALTPKLIRQTVGPMRHKREYRRWLLATLPAIVMVCAAHAVGEFAGLVSGAGDSPSALD